jgi:hypothetical protein
MLSVSLRIVKTNEELQGNPRFLDFLDGPGRITFIGIDKRLITGGVDR